ncbi:MAG: hypothetical protein WCG06_03060 [Candidatus Omnitrophota bacterium]
MINEELSVGDACGGLPRTGGRSKTAEDRGTPQAAGPTDNSELIAGPRESRASWVGFEE